MCLARQASGRASWGLSVCFPCFPPIRARLGGERPAPRARQVPNNGGGRRRDDRAREREPAREGGRAAAAHREAHPARCGRARAACAPVAVAWSAERRRAWLSVWAGLSSCALIKWPEPLSGTMRAALCSNRHGPGGRPMAAPGQPSAPRSSQEQRPTRTCFQGVLPCAAPLSALAGLQCAHDHANLWAPLKLAPAQARWTACCSCRARSRLPRWSRGRRCPASGCRRRSTRARLRRLLGRRDAALGAAGVSSTGVYALCPTFSFWVRNAVELGFPCAQKIPRHPRHLTACWIVLAQALLLCKCKERM
jgi:hypothetical protein